MIRRLSPAAALAAALVLCAACGPPEARRPNFFTLEPTKECFEDADLRVSTAPKDLRFIIGNAPAGGLRVWLPDNSFLIGFGESDEDAADMVAAFRRVAPTPQARRRVNSLVEPRGNVVINWINEPNRRQLDLVYSCLR